MVPHFPTVPNLPPHACASPPPLGRVLFLSFDGTSRLTPLHGGELHLICRLARSRVQVSQGFFFSFPETSALFLLLFRGVDDPNDCLFAFATRPTAARRFFPPPQEDHVSFCPGLVSFSFARDLLFLQSMAVFTLSFFFPHEPRFIGGKTRSRLLDWAPFFSPPGRGQTAITSAWPRGHRQAPSFSVLLVP